MVKKNVAPLKQENQITSKDKFYIAVVVLVVLAAFVLMLVNSSQEKKNDDINVQDQIASTSTKPNIQTIVDKISSLLFTQNKEKPLVVSIVNIDELLAKDPVFYKDAQNGDKILIWSEKIALYSTTFDKLISVMPRELWDKQNTTTSSSTAAESTSFQEKPVILVKNGTTQVGLAKIVADQLVEKGLIISSTGDAKSKNYAQTKIIKLTDQSYPKTEQALESSLKVEIITGDPKNYADKADYIIVVGRDLAN